MNYGQNIPIWAISGSLVVISGKMLRYTLYTKNREVAKAIQKTWGRGTLAGSRLRFEGRSALLTMKHMGADLRILGRCSDFLENPCDLTKNALVDAIADLHLPWVA